jgi:hypothetical protein
MIVQPSRGGTPIAERVCILTCPDRNVNAPAIGIAGQSPVGNRMIAAAITTSPGMPQTTAVRRFGPLGVPRYGFPKASWGHSRTILLEAERLTFHLNRPSSLSGGRVLVEVYALPQSVTYA